MVRLTHDVAIKYRPKLHQRRTNCNQYDYRISLIAFQIKAMSITGEQKRQAPFSMAIENI